MKRKPAKPTAHESRVEPGHDVARLEDIPNGGPAIAGDLRQLGITSPAELLGRDPYTFGRRVLYPKI